MNCLSFFHLQCPLKETKTGSRGCQNAYHSEILVSFYLGCAVSCMFFMIPTILIDSNSYLLKCDWAPVSSACLIIVFSILITTAFCWMQFRCFIVATCDRDLKRRIRKVKWKKNSYSIFHCWNLTLMCELGLVQIPGVPIMYITRHRYSIERLPEATIGGGKHN